MAEAELPAAELPAVELPAAEAPAAEPSGAEGGAGTGRLEAFSDGVFGVAITLLVLSLAVPPLEDKTRLLHGLAAALLKQWPFYLAYALSFLTILIMWINHHALFRLIRRTNHLFLLLNGLLLLIITAFPFATDLLATYLTQPVGADRRTAQLVYSGLSLVMALTFYAMWTYASRGDRLLGARVDRRLVRTVTAQYRFGPPLYAVAFALAFVSAEVSLALNMLMAVFFALPSTVTRAMSD